jgi:hypothetical protein
LTSASAAALLAAFVEVVFLASSTAFNTGADLSLAAFASAATYACLAFSSSCVANTSFSFFAVSSLIAAAFAYCVAKLAEFLSSAADFLSSKIFSFKAF